MDISDGASRGAANTTTTTSHPLAKSITRLSEGFSRDAPRIAADGRSEQVVNGLDDFLGQQLHQLRGGATLEGVATACAHARRLVQRVCDEAFMMYPQLAPRSHKELAHGAGGVELLSMVERSAYGALRRTLVSLHVEASPETARKYQVQLRLLARLTPEKLGLPSAFCGSSSNSTASSSKPTDASTTGAAQPLPYNTAIQRLQKLPQATTPERGLQCLVDVCHLVATGAEEIGAPPPAAGPIPRKPP